VRKATFHSGQPVRSSGNHTGGSAGAALSAGVAARWPLAARKNHRSASFHCSSCHSCGCFSCAAQAMKSRADWTVTSAQPRRQKLRNQRRVISKDCLRRSGRSAWVRTSRQSGNSMRCAFAGVISAAISAVYQEQPVCLRRWPSFLGCWLSRR
jgi:hypothetical protein